jgi:hypothetical protein
MKTLHPDKAGDQNEGILTAMPAATKYRYVIQCDTNTDTVNSKETYLIIHTYIQIKVEWYFHTIMQNTYKMKC